MFDVLTVNNIDNNIASNYKQYKILNSPNKQSIDFVKKVPNPSRFQYNKLVIILVCLSNFNLNRSSDT